MNDDTQIGHLPPAVMEESSQTAVLGVSVWRCPAPARCSLLQAGSMCMCFTGGRWTEVIASVYMGPRMPA